MVYSLVVRARGLEHGGREFKSRSLHLKPETELREERGLSGCRKGLTTVPLAQALLNLKPAKTNKNKQKRLQMKDVWCLASRNPKIELELQGYNKPKMKAS